MKKNLIVFLMIPILLNGCAQTTPEPSTAPPTTEPTQATEAPTTMPTDPPTEPTTEPTELLAESLYNEYYAPILGYHTEVTLDDVYVYPYTQEDIDSAMDYLRDLEAEFLAKESVLDVELHWFTFDPIKLYREMLGHDPVAKRYPQPSREEDYRNTLIFSGRYSVRYAHTFSPGMDGDYEEFTVILCRETPDAPWEHYGHHNRPGFGYDYHILQQEEINALNLTDERIVAGYFVSADALLSSDVLLGVERPVPYEQDTYILYVVDEETNTVVCREYPAE